MKKKNKIENRRREKRYVKLRRCVVRRKERSKPGERECLARRQKKKKEENKQIREKGEGIKKKRESLEERLFVCRHLFLKLSQIKTVLTSCWEGATLCDFDIHLISPLGVCD